MQNFQILLTNDDGIRSPGLWAAAQALSTLGYVHVTAPRQQSSGAGRSLPGNSDGIIQKQEMQVNGQTWSVYAIGGSPSQVVLHAVLEILPQPPDLLVSGINYGENVGSGVTISGTVGAALEGASLGIPSIAISLETELHHHYSLSEEVDFATAAHFIVYFARQMLERKLLPDIDVLKIDVPCDASPNTPWCVTRLSHHRYFEPTAPQRDSWLESGRVGYRPMDEHIFGEPGSDVYALRKMRNVSVTPLSLDLTSRVDLTKLDRLLRTE